MNQRPELTVWELVRQSSLIHPEWDVESHVAWLDDERPDWRDKTFPSEADPRLTTHEQLVTWWLARMPSVAEGRFLGSLLGHSA